MTTSKLEEVARAIAIAHGDKWDDVPNDKAHWIEQRGQFGGRFRDVNENFKDCYRDEARAAIEAMREPTSAMLTYEHDHMMVHASCHMCGGHLEGWRLMIDAALAEGEEG